LFEPVDANPPAIVQETVGGYMYWAELLGQRTGELHLALAAAEDPAFRPEPFTRLYQRSLYQSMRSQARGTLELLRSQKSRLDAEALGRAERLFAREGVIFEHLGQLLHERIEARRIRCHGDYHLGQVLFTGKDFVIIDFEGEPERPVSERRIKASPLRDVAGMLRSLHYVSHAALGEKTPGLVVENLAAPVDRWASFWTAWTSAAFLHSYLEAAKDGSFLPAERRQLETLLTAYLLEKALYELRYELNNRPDWVKLPLDGILQLLEREPA
jgi:maltose alpha-D-glucosyltransferase/alpha-amylase